MRKLGSSIAAFTLAMANWVDCSPALLRAADVPSVLRSQAGDEHYPYHLLADPATVPTAMRSDGLCPILDWAQGCGDFRGYCPGQAAASAADYSEEGCEANDCLADDTDYCGDEDSYADDEDSYADEDNYADDDSYADEDLADNDVPPPVYQPSYVSDDDWDADSSYGEGYARDAESSYAESYAGESEDTDVYADNEDSADNYESDYGDEWDYGYRASNRYSGNYGDDDAETSVNESASVEDDEPTDSSGDSYDEPCYSDYWTREYGRPTAPAPVEAAPVQRPAYDYESEYGDYQQYGEPGYSDEDWSPEYAPATADRAPVADAGESWDDYSEGYEDYDYDSAELAPIDEEAPTATAPAAEGDDSLACVVDAWPSLPSGVKTVIMAMVKLSGSTR